MPTSSSAGHLTPSLQQSRNTNLPINSSQDAPSHNKPIDTTKHSTRHGVALQRSATSTRTQAQVPQLGNLQKALVQSQPLGADSTNKKSYSLPACKKKTLNSTLNKMKRWRNMQQIKGHGKNSQDQTS